MSVLRGLQDLLLKMGGTPVSGDNTDELVRKIAKAYDPATQELPSVTSEDKDKYLHTNSSTGALEWKDEDQELPSVTSEDKDKYLHTNEDTGALEWSEVEGGGDDVFIITVSGTPGLLVSDKTPQEITDAYIQGKILYLKYARYDGYIYYLSDINVDSNYSRFDHNIFDTANHSINKYSVSISIDSGTTRIIAYEGYSRIPNIDTNFYLEQVSFEIEFSSEDNDYVLQSNLSSADYGSSSIGFVIEGIIGGYKVATAVKHIVSNSEEPFLDKTLEFYTLNNAYSELVDTGNGEEYIGHLIFKTFVTDNGALKLRTLDIYAEIQTEFADGGWNFTITDTAL